MKIKSLFILLFLSVFTFAHAQLTDYSIFDKKFNFYVANDLGRNGYYDQKPIAELMGTMGEEIGPEFVLATGDVHHFDGVRSVNDPLWMTNYELIYSHPELMIDWFSILGNHEYRGSTQAVLDYTNISRRWSMPDRYYTKVFEEKGATIRIVWIDTTPLIDKYRNESDKYPDACKQDISKQLSWLESVLASAKEDWIIVAGHHPIYAYTPKELCDKVFDRLFEEAEIAKFTPQEMREYETSKMAYRDIKNSLVQALQFILEAAETKKLPPYGVLPTFNDSLLDDQVQIALELIFGE